MKKHWRKSSRWRAARERAIDTENVRLWVKLCRLERNEPVFPKRWSVQDFANVSATPWKFLKMATQMLQFDAFAMPKRFPRNAGATIRFVK